jgi:DNA-binding response OmpR family regulator
MSHNAGKLLVVESDQALRDHIAAVLRDAGYQVSTDYREGIKAVIAFDPDAVILDADPPQLDCCDLLSEIKGSEHTDNIRVVLLSPGGSAERTRGLDLGARPCAVTARMFESIFCPVGECRSFARN